MRKWHRWLSLALFLPLAFVAATGLLSHWAALWPQQGAVVPEASAHEGKAEAEAGAAKAPGQAAIAAPPAAFACPAGWRCEPEKARPTSGPRAWVGFFHHLHSGEEFGPLGIAISILAGLGLLFFSISGIWMYAQMWSQRRGRGAKDRWFWK